MLNKKKLEDGLVIYQREDIASGNWHCRLRHRANKKYFRKSLGTASIQEARKRAYLLQEKLLVAPANNNPFSPKSFKYAVEQYLSGLRFEVAHGSETQSKLKNHLARSKYMLEYFGDKNINEISNKDILDFISWRKTYWISGPGKNKEISYKKGEGDPIGYVPKKKTAPVGSTINRENAVLRAIFKLAHTNDWIKDAPPDIPREPEKLSKRPDFEEHEIHVILEAAKERFENAASQHHKRQRGMLYGFLGVMILTGMRPLEAMPLQWEHITFENDFVRVQVSGKGKSRELVADKKLEDVLAFILSLYSIDAFGDPGAIETYDLASSKGFIFKNANGEQVKSLRKSLNSLLTSVGMKVDQSGKVRQAYSFRHYYATDMIKKNVAETALSRNMGTSIKMLEDYYVHATPDQLADQLVGQNKLGFLLPGVGNNQRIAKKVKAQLYHDGTGEHPDGEATEQFVEGLLKDVQEKFKGKK